MIKRGTPGGFIFTVVLLVAVLHSIYHFGVFGTGIQGLGDKGVSGFMVGKTDIGEELKAATPISPLGSSIFLLFEWSFIVVLVGIFLVKRRREIKVEAEVENENDGELLDDVFPSPSQVEGDSGVETDLDKLYSMVKRQKKLRISSVVRLFNINKETAMEWAMTLESGNLIKIQYPRFGEPMLVLQEGQDEKDKEKS